MTAYSCRVIAPTVSGRFDIGTDSPEKAAMEFFHMDCDTLPRIRHRIEYPDGTVEYVLLCRVEVLETGTDKRMEFVARVFKSGIWRRGGVHLPEPTIEEIAKMLRWNGEPEELLASGWDEEESWEDAKKRR